MCFSVVAPASFENVKEKVWEEGKGDTVCRRSSRGDVRVKGKQGFIARKLGLRRSGGISVMCFCQTGIIKR